MNYATNRTAATPASLPGWRASALFMVLAAGLFGLLGRGVYLQGIHNDFLQEKGNARYSRVIEVSAHRGVIRDRNGEVLAVSTPVQSVWASPADVEANNQQIKSLATVLKMSEPEVRHQLFDNTRDFVYLKRQISPDQAGQVTRLNVAGVSLQPEYRRYYPSGEVAAQLLGFTGQDDNGQEGLELGLQDSLGGKPGSQRVIKDRRGHIVEDVASLRAPKPGSDVVLSVDSKIQYLAYRELQAAVEKNHAKAGAVVVLDARTGEVLALANYPSYNPNNRVKISPQAMRNRAVADLFEPGSTLKPFTVAAAIENGKVRPDTLINTEHGVYTVGGRQIHDSHAEAFLSVSGVIQKSSNVGAAKMALMLEPQVMWQSLSDSGFGAHTGSNFPGEATGKLREAKTWRPIEQATMAYGHGISVNLLQLARAYTVFANNGELKPISLMKLDAPPVGKKILSDKTALALRDMLETVVLPGGTAPLAQVAGYRVAGKTGTAHKLSGAHYVDKYVASFVGLAPASAPRVIVAVMIDEPDNGQYYGGLVAAPVFSQVTGETLHLLNVPNDAPLNNVIAPPADVIREEV
ncbi:MAG: penicillin-binding protein 2 [Gallionella sp.]|jgi:cell division protein FtsI (penicillin-binding protein 3)|nr:penicillin-binding protein 2 [Gallionella sp.]